MYKLRTLCYKLHGCSKVTYSTSLLPYWYQQEGDGRARAITLTDQLPLELAKQYIPQVTVVASSVSANRSGCVRRDPELVIE